MKRIFLLLLSVNILMSISSSFAQSKIKVACVGNSITEGGGLKENEKYPAILQVLLGESSEVRNYGIGGRTLLKKGDYPYWNEAKYREVLDWKPDIVVIKLGTNDSKPQNWKYKSDFEQNYIEFIDSFKSLSSQPKIYICYPIPVFEDKWGITGRIVKDEIIPSVKKIARKTHVKKIDLYTPFLQKDNLTYDKIHPNVQGDSLLAAEVFRKIKK